MNEDEIRKRIEVLEVRENGYLEVGNTRQANKIWNEIYKWKDLLERINGNLEKKIEKLEKQSKVIDRQAQKYFEQTIYLNKIIDLMADFMYKTGTGRKALSCVFRQNDECNENGCEYCIKRYFAGLVEKE